MSTTQSSSNPTEAAGACACARPTECIDRRPGRYLVAVRWLAIDDEVNASTGTISDRLGVAPASATEMLERLAAADLLVREPPGDVALTDRGERLAAELAWRRRLTRRFLDAIAVGEVDPEAAYRIGYHLHSDAMDRLAGLAFDCR